MNGWLNINQLLTNRCLLCGAAAARDHALCLGCLDDLPTLGCACPRCGVPLPGAVAAPCGACQLHPPAFDHTVALCHYAPPVQQLLTALKFHRRLAVAPTLARMMAARLEEQSPLPDLVLPVPLHPQRLRERGYNQAVELARPLARLLDIPLELHALHRIRHTPPQTELDADQRRRNLRDAFALTRPLRARRVAVVDDIMTTGSTVATIAKLLRAHGAQHVAIWVFARTPAA